MFVNRFNAVILFFLIAVVIPVVDLHAAGAREDRVGEVESLLDEKQYNDALLLLADILKEEPERLNELQNLLSRVREEKEDYNDKYEELIETYSGDDIEAAYPIIKELEDLDPEPNEATRISLVLARETAGFVFNNNRWTDIMERGAALLEEEKYAQAVETYMEGFNLSRDIFDDSGYGNIILNDVYSRADEMTELSLEFIENYSSFLDTVDLVNDLIAQKRVPELIVELEDFYAELQRTAEIRENLKDLADYFLIQEESIRRSQADDKQVHYLIYLDRLLNGRTTVDGREGITGAIELLWNDAYKTTEAGALAMADEIYSSAYDMYREGMLTEAEEAFSDVVIAAESTLRTLETGESYLESDAAAAREGLLAMQEEQLASQISLAVDISDTASAFIDVIEKRGYLNDLKARIASLDEQAEGFREAGNSIKTELETEYSDLNARSSDWNTRKDELSSLEMSGVDVQRSLQKVDAIEAELLSLAAETLETEIFFTAMMGSADLEKLESRYEQGALEFMDSKALIEGIVQIDDQAGEEADEEFDYQVVYRYPDRALERLVALQAELNNLLDAIEGLSGFIDSERGVIRNGAPVQAVAEGAADLQGRSSDLLSDALQLTEEARTQIFNAEKAAQEGERRIEESRTLAQRAQFAAAKERLEQAALRFDESLSLMEDTVLRNYRDNEIPRLYEEIQAAENNLVIRQVRELLTQAKTSYSQGNFPVAQNLLIRAQSRWSDTNVEPNEEVEYWLTLTQTALSVTSGRAIAPTDPLYAEMNQYLNQARSEFNRAREELTAGRREEANRYFDRAEQNLLFVQQFFPFNEEARVLNLRISQYRNPEQFNEIFGNDFRAARSLISSNPQKAYIDLKDLEAINPSFPGLQAAITEAEYATGIRVRPPDPQKLQRSRELYELALNIVNRNVRSEFNVALSYLDEALNLNPDNLDAIRLKDRISSDVGGTATAVMSSADQQLYQEAVREFTAGNYLRARIIVENLLKNPDNQRNTRLIELKERIERTR